MFINSFIDWLRQKKRRLFQHFYVAHRPIEWRRLRKDTEDIHGDGGVFVIPPDPWSLTGSRGDEAMLMVLHQQFPSQPFYVVTATPEASSAARAHGWIPSDCWNSRGLYYNIYNAAKHIRPSFCAVLGADIMDGYYSPGSSVAFFAMADIFFRHHVPTSLIGFSFNSHPHPKVLECIKKVDAGLECHLRDEVSLERFEKTTGRKGTLTADIAFLLEPNIDTRQYCQVSQWKQKEGKPLLIVNIHPMLIKNASSEQISGMLDVMREVISEVLERSEWLLLLLPHDNRKGVNDNICLSPLYESLSGCFSGHLMFMPEVLDAARLKGIVSLADALVTSRMHLGIAGLSLAVPTMGFAYQDKFQGMIRHLGLGDEYILPEPKQQNVPMIVERILYLLERRAATHANIQAKLPGVKALARRNLEASRALCPAIS